MIYADCAAQRPPYKEAADAAVYAMQSFGNPSGLHSVSSSAARLLFDARRRTAAALGAQPSEIIFTASGTEADNLAVFNAAERLPERKRLLIFAAEHKAVLNSALNAEKYLGCRVEYIPCLPDGTADMCALEKMLGPDAALVSLMHANNETGVIQPVREAARLAHSCGALFHTDAVQTAGHIPVNVKELGCDLLSVSAHKLGGIPGAGALCCRANIKLLPLIAGGGQERGVRAGTEALPAICAMGAAIEKSCAEMERDAEYVSGLRDLLQMLLSENEGVIFPGADAERVPGTLCACFPNQDGERLALMLDRAGICASSGAACTTGEPGASHVLEAMGLPQNVSRGALRFSLCERNTAEEMHIIAERVKELI